MNRGLRGGAVEVEDEVSFRSDTFLPDASSPYIATSKAPLSFLFCCSPSNSAATVPLSSAHQEKVWMKRSFGSTSQRVPAPRLLLLLLHAAARRGPSSVQAQFCGWSDKPALTDTQTTATSTLDQHGRKARRSR